MDGGFWEFSGADEVGEWYGVCSAGEEVGVGG